MKSWYNSNIRDLFLSSINLTFVTMKISSKLLSKIFYQNTLWFVSQLENIQKCSNNILLSMISNQVHMPQARCDNMKLLSKILFRKIVVEHFLILCTLNTFILVFVHKQSYLLFIIPIFFSSSSLLDWGHLKYTLPWSTLTCTKYICNTPYHVNNFQV